MKRKPALALLLAALLALIGCAPATPTSPPATATPTPASTITPEPTPVPLWYEAHYLRDGFSDGASGVILSAVVVRSLDELGAYYRSHGDVYALAVSEHPYPDVPSVGFIEESEPFASAFFDQYALVFLRTIEFSGSHRHIIRSVTRHEGEILIDVDRYMGGGTCDMAAWHIIVKIKKAAYGGETVRAEFTDVYLEDGQPYPW